MGIEFFKELSRNYIVFCVDLETTGFSSSGGWLGNDILTWSVSIADNELNLIKKITLKSRPESEHTWSDEAEQEAHKISFYEAMTFPSKKEFLINLMNLIKEEAIDKGKEIIWVEHSNDWIDWNFTMGAFLKFELINKFRKVFNKRFSTIKLGRSAGYKKNKLDLWAERIGFELKHHESESDSECCLQVLKHLRDKNSGTLFDFI